VKIISFCLWGDDPKYTAGAIENSRLAASIYGDWLPRFYCANDVPRDVVLKLSEYSDVVQIDTSGDWKFTVERFRAIDDDGVTHVIFRDTDSRLNDREASAVEEWIKSGKTLHVMKDHPHHGGFPILAGMWGINKKRFTLNMTDMLSIYHNKEQYHYDQIFLRDYIWRFYSNDCITHDEIFNSNRFPTERIGLEFVGQVFDENEETVVEHLRALESWCNR